MSPDSQHASQGGTPLFPRTASVPIEQLVRCSLIDSIEPRSFTGLGFRQGFDWAAEDAMPWEPIVVLLSVLGLVGRIVWGGALTFSRSLYSQGWGGVASRHLCLQHTPLSGWAHIQCTPGQPHQHFLQGSLHICHAYPSNLCLAGRMLVWGIRSLAPADWQHRQHASPPQK